MSKEPKIEDWRGLYGILDPDHRVGSVLEFADALISGGCSILQLRAKSLSDRESLRLAKELRIRTQTHGVWFVMNDRVDLALLANADGVHLGQDDLPLCEARKLAPHLVIGVSTHDAEQARRASEEGADLLALGPIFPTLSKDNPDPVVGLETLRTVAASVSQPVVAIGGIDLLTIAETRDAGARMVAVIGALARADDPRQAAERLRARFEQGSGFEQRGASFERRAPVEPEGES